MQAQALACESSYGNERRLKPAATELKKNSHHEKDLLELKNAEHATLKLLPE
jgi:hypothetical protein